MILSVFSCTYWSFVYLWSIYILCPFFNWVVFLLLIYINFIYFGNNSFVRYMYCEYFMSIHFLFKYLLWNKTYRKVAKIVQKISIYPSPGTHKCYFTKKKKMLFYQSACQLFLSYTHTHTNSFFWTIWH